MVGGPLADRMRLYCNSDKWPYRWVTAVITTTNKVITLLVSGRGPPCRVLNDCFPSFGGLVPEIHLKSVQPRFHKMEDERNNSDGN